MFQYGKGFYVVAVREKVKTMHVFNVIVFTYNLKIIRQRYGIAGNI
jgi:hypothetical protein